MENMQVASPFKSPESFPLRRRLGSGSPASSLDKESPHRRQNFSSGKVVVVAAADENDPPIDALPSGGGGERVNPFEKDILGNLQTSFWSPSIMEIKETPPQRKWAIDQLSILFPKDIENSPSTHQNELPVDAEAEAKAQADIKTYFNRELIVPTPSPMKDNSRGQISDMMRLNKTTIPYLPCGQSPVGRGGGVLCLNNSNLMLKKMSTTKRVIVPSTDRWTQTALSLPANLPPHVQEILSQYSMTNDLCGSSAADETLAMCSQKSEMSEHGEYVDNDSGKNSSSYLNNSIRRRLDLSFGEDQNDDENSRPASPIENPDPFRRNHVVSTPPSSAYPTTAVSVMNTTTSELEMQFMRCEFTPESRGVQNSVTPGITPIQDDPEEDFDGRLSRASCSTPRRTDTNANRRRGIKDFAIPNSPSVMEEDEQEDDNDDTSETESAPPNLRRAHPDRFLPTGAVKTGSASSFDDSQLLMDDSSPPAKLYRRDSQNAS